MTRLNVDARCGARRSGARCAVSPRPRAPVRAPPGAGGGPRAPRGNASRTSADALRMHFDLRRDNTAPSAFLPGARWRDLAEQRRGGRAPPARATGRAGARRGTAGTLDPVGPPRALRGLPALAAGKPPPPTPFPPSASVCAGGGEEGVGTQAGGRERALFFVDQCCGRWQRGVCACGCRAGRRASSWMRAGT